MPHEFELIEQIIAGLGDAQGVQLGPGDDCALTAIGDGQSLASSIDSFLPDCHFPRSADPWLIAQRCFRAALSDLAAMGAKPAFALVTLTLEKADTVWVEGFTQGLKDAAGHFRCPIAGGNLAFGPMNVGISVHGKVGANEALTRSGAQPEQDVYVSGVLGGARQALEALDKCLNSEAIRSLAEHDREAPLVRYWLPEPRLRLGTAIKGLVSAAIDISDGLIADAWHIAKASEAGLCFNVSDLPKIGDFAASDDYELLFTAPRSARPRIAMLAQSLSVKVTRIGETCEQVGVWVDEEAIAQYRSGYRHFTPLRSTRPS